MARMRAAFVLAVVTLWSSSCGEPSRPKLGVVVVVDQMRFDYLERFREQFTGGLARLLESGAVFTDAHQDHAFTETAPGHATIATGAFPSHHGIVSNNWWERAEGGVVYSVEDAEAPLVGDTEAGGRSPNRLRRSTLGDWLLESSPESRVLSVAIKDRSAILMGGHRGRSVYWYQPASGSFTTSTYYRQEYPSWVTRLNEARAADRFRIRQWTQLFDPEAYAASREDHYSSEFDGQHTTFPHDPSDDLTYGRIGYYQALLYTPFADELVLDFAKEGVIAEGLGADSIPDLLFIGASAADFIGHAYGPYSQEVQDYYLRLDRLLGDFFAFLDGQVGAGSYVVALSGDHGVLPMVEELRRRNVDAGRVDPAELEPALRHIVSGAVRELAITRPPELHRANGIVLDFGDAPPDSVAVAALRRRVAEHLRGHDAIADTYTPEELAADTTADRPYLEAFRRSFYPNRVADVLLRLREHYLATNRPTFTSHGSPYRYDTHIPLIVLGPGVTPGRRDEHVRSVDLAPTLAALLGITPPGDLDGGRLDMNQ